MRKKKAKEILENQINKLADSQKLFSQLWFVNTQSYLRDMLGDDSLEFRRMYNTYRPFDDLEWNPFKNKKEPVTEEEIKIYRNELTNFLRDCQETIENKGIYKQQKGNFLSNVRSEVILGVLIFILPIIYYAGFEIASNKGDIQSNSMKTEIEDLKRSIKTKDDSLYILRENYPAA
jgi:hypothetical protein